MQVTKLFGTDGIRSPFGAGVLTPKNLETLGHALGAFLVKRQQCGIAIAHDPRPSAPELQRHFVAGLSKWPLKIIDYGCLPTPALAIITRETPADIGIMLSASHNPATDNGLKFFQGTGDKWSLKDEGALEALFGSPPPLPGPHDVATFQMSSRGEALYRDALLSHFPSLSLRGITLCVDAANGAMSGIAERTLEQLGATVVETASVPSGGNINDGVGALFPKTVQKFVQKHQSFCGISFDGDGDRVIFSTPNGTEIDGDQLLAFLASSFKQRSKLPHQMVCSTHMANAALEVSLSQNGIQLLRSDVGDRFVAKALEKSGSALGGEPSGHLIWSPHLNCSDGLCTALLFLEAVIQDGRALDDIFPYFQKFPQATLSIPRPTEIEIEAYMHRLQDLFAPLEERLLPKGRLLLRPSGTEPIFRLMMEHPAPELLASLLEEAKTQIQKLTAQEQTTHTTLKKKTQRAP
jgi:phosphoglucosamine mutase